MDESHRYMVKDNNSLSFQSIQKIMKEGRKFGIGAWIISQRPSNISPDILSQIGTFIGLRMTNREDSNSIKVFAQNNIGNFLNNLSGLKIGEAVGVGVSIKTPARFKIPLLDTVKNIKFDEQIDKWKRNYQDDNQYDDVVNKWRRKI
jgi:DNA helicase HerA-like ATPase